jgi:hypothetical protein
MSGDEFAAALTETVWRLFPRVDTPETVPLLVGYAIG